MLRCDLNASTADDVVNTLKVSTADALIEKDKHSIEKMVSFAHKDRAVLVDNNPEHDLPYDFTFNLLVLRQWAVICVRLGNSYYDICEEAAFKETAVFIKETEQRKLCAESAQAKKPPPLKDMEKWTTWWPLFDGYMSNHYGAADTPLNYIYRPNTQPMVDPNKRYQTTALKFVDTLLLEGTDFHADNLKAYQMFRELVVGGPGWGFVKNLDQSHDGRAAILKLKAEAEGKDSKIHRRQRAHGILNTSTFSGKSRNHTFGDFVTTFTDCFSELEACGEVVSEVRKVEDFMKSISDPMLDVAKDLVRYDSKLSDDFLACEQFMRSIKAAREPVTKAVAARNISAAGAKDNNGFLSSDEWNKLSKEEQKRVVNTRRNKNRRGKGSKKRKGNVGNNGDKRRKVSEVSTDDREDEEDDEEEAMKPPARGGNTGKQFGRNAYRKGSQS